MLRRIVLFLNRRRDRLAAGSVMAMVAACGGGSSAGAGADAGGAPAVEAAADLPPTFTDDERSKMRELSPAELPPPPPDVSNHWADDPVASALGLKLFSEKAFSGALIDVDDDGGPNTLGNRNDVGKVSCAGCHIPESGFSDTRSTFEEISLATGWTKRRTPSIIDVGQAKMIMWGGRHSTLYEQVFGPIENPIEMNSSRLYVAHKVADLYRTEYEAVFGADSLAPLSDEARFPRLTAESTGCRLKQTIDHPRAPALDPLYECHGMPGDGAEYDGMAPADQDVVTRIVVNVGKAIGAYERTLTCGKGRFDSFVGGDSSALNPSEQRGLQLFLGRAQCTRCHSGPYFSDQTFHNLGLLEKPTREGIFNGNDRGAAADLPLAMADPLSIAGKYSDGNDGRIPAAVLPEHEGAFRTPTLRCVAKRPRFMHSGLVLTLDEAIAFLNRGGDDPGSFVGVGVLKPLGLSSDEQHDLQAFLESLDGVAR
jgi:cytochrome c peroxidase